MSYPKANERDWVRAILVRLTPGQRKRYEMEMAQTEGHPNSGKKYDDLKAKVAERIMYEDALKEGK